MAPPAMSSPRRMTVGSSRMAICNASLMACWYVIVRVAVSATISASLPVVSRFFSIRDVDVGQSLFRLGKRGGLGGGPGVIELLRHSRVDCIELVLAGDAAIDNSRAQRGDRIPLLVQVKFVGRAISHLVTLKVPVEPVGLG